MPHEILDQVLTTRELFPGTPVTNIVFMGMGEPALNLPSVLKSVALLSDPEWSVLFRLFFELLSKNTHTQGSDFRSATSPFLLSASLTRCR